MYIEQIQIQNIRSIVNTNWELPDDQSGAGWHVVIGDNGSGKSTFLRSVALALIGPYQANALREDWNDWLRKGEDAGVIRLDLSYNREIDKFSGGGNTVQRYLLPAAISFSRDGSDVQIKKPSGLRLNPERHVWGGKSGWFSASYGPFRRFSGGDKDAERMFYSNPKLAAHLSVFGEDVALIESLRWLQELQFKKLENRPEGKILDHITKFLNQDGFLPHRASLKNVSSNGVEFVDGNGFQLPVEELSDGYRSILSMTFELIRQLAQVYSVDNIFDRNDSSKVISPGVVLIDEIDAHLHPSWQRNIGLWMKGHFPHIQFIVTTHSPLVCQAASDGTIWRLPKPGTSNVGGMVTGVERDRLIFGNILDAYSTEMFGQDITRSSESKIRLKRLAELNRKELNGGLSVEEIEEQRVLRTYLPTSAHSTNGN